MTETKLNDYKKEICMVYVTAGCEYCVAYNKKLKACFFDIRKAYEEMKDITLFKEDEE